MREEKIRVRFFRLRSLGKVRPRPQRPAYKRRGEQPASASTKLLASSLLQHTCSSRAAATMSPLVCLVLAFSLGTVATVSVARVIVSFGLKRALWSFVFPPQNESSKLLGSERKTVSLLSSPTEEPEERSVSKLIENVNKNNGNIGGFRLGRLE